MSRVLGQNSKSIDVQMVKGFLQLAAIAYFAASATAATAESVAFDVYIKGVKGGKLSYSAKMNDAGYSASAKVRATGIVKKISDFRFDASVNGTVAGNAFVPARYEEKSDTGKRTSKKTLSYRNRIPTLTRSDGKQKKYWLDPKKQSDALDPMTGMYLLMRDVPKGETCTLNVDLFDGARRVNLALKPNGANGCKGTYTRKGGFSRKELKEGKSFPFKLEYKKDGDMMRLQEMEFATVRGRAKLVRR